MQRKNDAGVYQLLFDKTSELIDHERLSTHDLSSVDRVLVSLCFGQL